MGGGGGREQRVAQREEGGDYESIGDIEYTGSVGVAMGNNLAYDILPPM